VIDGQVLAELSKALKPQMVARTIHLYLVESPKLVEKLKHGSAAGDAQQMASAAHSLKSSSANVGAKVLSRYCEQVEAAARRADVEEARKMAMAIEKEHGCVQTALSAEYEALAGSKAES
jgi:HPt (histidine-containing phosphotransfer) domain-containing protein